MKSHLAQEREETETAYNIQCIRAAHIWHHICLLLCNKNQMQSCCSYSILQIVLVHSWCI